MNASSKVVNVVEEEKVIPLHVHANREYISNILEVNREFYEFYVLRYMKKMHPQHDSIVDVGSNIGNHAKYYGNFLEYKNIYCFEPHDANFKVLQANVKDLACVCYNCALGAVKSKCDIFDSLPNNMGSMQIKQGDKIDIIPLDDFGIKNITMLKIDVEGAEYEVLLGGMRSILKYKPPIFIETASFKVFELLNMIGYKERNRFYEGNAPIGDVATVEFIHEGKRYV